MRINITSLYVADQQQALDVYTRVLGFEVKHNVPVCDGARWLTLVSPEDPDGTELLLEPMGHPAAAVFCEALYADGLPFTQFEVADIEAEYRRLLAACAGPEPAPAPGPGTVTSTVTASPPAATSSTPPDIAPLGTPGTGRQEHWPSLVGLTVTGYRIGEHATFDRLVFDLAGEGEPGWFIQYTDEPLQQASGPPVEYEGTTALQVIIMGTPYPMDDDSALLDHGRHPGGGVINHVTYASLFEANSEFVVGLDERHPYSITYLESPKRLVIDLVTD